MKARQPDACRVLTLWIVCRGAQTRLPCQARESRKVLAVMLGSHALQGRAGQTSSRCREVVALPSIISATAIQAGAVSVKVCYKKDSKAARRLPLCSRSLLSASFLSTSYSVIIRSMSSFFSFTAASSLSLHTTFAVTACNLTLGKALGLLVTPDTHANHCGTVHLGMQPHRDRCASCFACAALKLAIACCAFELSSSFSSTCHAHRCNCNYHRGSVKSKAWTWWQSNCRCLTWSVSVSSALDCSASSLPFFFPSCSKLSAMLRACN